MSLHATDKVLVAACFRVAKAGPILECDAVISSPEYYVIVLDKGDPSDNVIINVFTNNGIELDRGLAISLECLLM